MPVVGLFRGPAFEVPHSKAKRIKGGEVGEDAAGQRYIDASGGAAVSCLGHGHPEVLAAMHAQLDQLAYAHTSFFTTEAAEELADALVRGAPAGISHAYFVSGGSEAMEAALKLARQYFVEIGQPQRRHFIARRQSYHGNTLGALAVGAPVNLEKALRLSDRLGGHLVSGHVDGLGTVIGVQEEARSERWTLEVPRELARYIASKGSICVDGVSLTVNEVEGTRFGVNLIPHTRQVTTFAIRKAGDAVNIEVDRMARYAERLAQFGNASVS